MSENLETTEPVEIKPEEFDFVKWMAGAYKPTRGSTVHQRGDLIAELDRIQEQIEVAELVPEEERSLADISPARLRMKYAELAKKFHDSGLFVRTAGHTKEEQLEISQGLDAEIDAEVEEMFEFNPAKEKPAVEGEESGEPPVTGPKSKEALDYRYKRSKDLSYYLLADGVQEPKFTAEQLKQFHWVVGEAEFSRIAADYQLASASLNEPDADFLPKPSTPDEAAE